jgi:hypothetical protein
MTEPIVLDSVEQQNKIPISEPFKKFFLDRDDILAIPGPALKIWMFHFKSEGPTNRSYVTNETLTKKLKMNKDKVGEWRTWLVKNGWLEELKPARHDGKFTPAEYKVTYPPLPGDATTNAANQRPKKFKKFFCRKEDIFLVPSNAFKIWLYYYRIEIHDWFLDSRPSAARTKDIAAKLDLDRDTVTDQRKWLVENGWLILLGKALGSSGVVKGPARDNDVVPVFQVARGHVPETRDGRRRNDPTRARAARPRPALPSLDGLPLAGQPTPVPSAPAGTKAAAVRAVRAVRAAKKTMVRP